jgi:hypothetical protein
MTQPNRANSGHETKAMPHRPQRGLSTSTGAAIIGEPAHKKGPFNAFCAFCAFCALLGGPKVIRLTKEDLAAGNA